MKAAYINEPGPPENIVVGDLPIPEPIDRQVLVQVAAVDVNPIDTYIRSGTVAMQLPRPYIVGCDLAGTVVKLGPGATRFREGDRVWGSNQGLMGRQGTFAEYAAVDECWLYPTPPEVSDEAAAACSLVGITAYLGLVRDATLHSGEILFVNGGTGGVGSMVVQMARAIGARVITTAGTDEKVAACRAAGRRPGDQLQDRRRGSTGQRICTRGRQPLVGNVARAELRSIVRATCPARPDGADGRPPSAAAVPRRTVLRQRLQAVRIRHVQCHARRATCRGRRHQSLDGCRPDQAQDRPRAAIGRDTRRPPIAGREHDRQVRDLGGEDRHPALNDADAMAGVGYNF